MAGQWLARPAGEGHTVEFQMDAFDSIFSDTSKVTGTVNQKRADGSVRTAKLSTGPTDMTAEAFGEAAMKGTTFAEKVKDGDVSRSRSRKDVTGAAARSAVNAMLGVTPDPVPAPVRKRGSAPTENG